jgi:hypothetical protein
MDANESEIARSGASAPQASTRLPQAVAAEPDMDDEPAAPPVTPTADADEAQEAPAEGGEPEPEN